MACQTNPQENLPENAVCVNSDCTDFECVSGSTLKTDQSGCDTCVVDNGAYTNDACTNIQCDDSYYPKTKLHCNEPGCSETLCVACSEKAAPEHGEYQPNTQCVDFVCDANYMADISGRDKCVACNNSGPGVIHSPVGQCTTFTCAAGYTATENGCTQCENFKSDVIYTTPGSCDKTSCTEGFVQNNNGDDNCTPCPNINTASNNRIVSNNLNLDMVYDPPGQCDTMSCEGENTHINGTACVECDVTRKDWCVPSQAEGQTDDVKECEKPGFILTDTEQRKYLCTFNAADSATCTQTDQLADPDYAQSRGQRSTMSDGSAIPEGAVGTDDFNNYLTFTTNGNSYSPETGDKNTPELTRCWKKSVNRIPLLPEDNGKQYQTRNRQDFMLQRGDGICQDPFVSSGDFSEDSSQHPGSVFVANNGDYVLADYTGNRIVRCTPPETYLSQPPGSVAQVNTGGVDPTRASVDCATVAGSDQKLPGDSANMLWGPSSVFVDSDENYIVVDKMNQKVKKCSLNGCVTVRLDIPDNVYPEKVGAACDLSPGEVQPPPAPAEEIPPCTDIPICTTRANIAGTYALNEETCECDFESPKTCNNPSLIVSNGTFGVLRCTIDSDGGGGSCHNVKPTNRPTTVKFMDDGTYFLKRTFDNVNGFQTKYNTSDVFTDSNGFAFNGHGEPFINDVEYLTNSNPFSVDLQVYNYDI